jgi:hypothetical protein
MPSTSPRRLTLVFKAHLGTTSGEGVPERQPLPRFNVQTVKMLSATCS